MNDEHYEHPLPWAVPGGHAPQDDQPEALPEQPQGDASELTGDSQTPAAEDLQTPAAGEDHRHQPELYTDAPSLPVAPGEQAAPDEHGVPALVHAEIVPIGSRRGDPRDRPHDPAGTQPKHDPESLLPRRLKSALLSSATEIGGDGEPTDLLPVRASAAGLGTPLATPVVTSTPYTPRFQFIKGALGALGVVGVAVAVLSLTGATASKPPPIWSSWKPADNGVDPAVQIAEHVAPEYRLDNGKRIVNVSGGPPVYKGQPLVLALLVSGQTPSELSDNSVLYELCGSGPNCTIAGGTASAQRGLLLRREALELALYTFHYLNVDDVVVTFPPAPPAAGTKTSTAAQPQRAVLFRPSALAPELAKGLASTLPQPTPTVDVMNRSVNANLVDSVTSKALYDSSYQQVPPPSSQWVLVLAPPTAAG